MTFEYSLLNQLFQLVNISHAISVIRSCQSFFLYSALQMHHDAIENSGKLATNQIIYWFCAAWWKFYFIFDCKLQWIKLHLTPIVGTDGISLLCKSSRSANAMLNYQYFERIKIHSWKQISFNGIMKTYNCNEYFANIHFIRR